MNADQTEEEPTRTLTVGGDAMKLDEFGPIIINTDGTTRRISNWASMNEQERASSWRLIAARNQRRKEELVKIREDRLAGCEEGAEEEPAAPLAIEDATSSFTLPSSKP